MMTELWWSIHYIFKYQISAVHLEYNVICQLHLKKKKPASINAVKVFLPWRPARRSRRNSHSTLFQFILLRAQEVVTLSYPHFTEGQTEALRSNNHLGRFPDSAPSLLPSRLRVVQALVCSGLYILPVKPADLPLTHWGFLNLAQPHGTSPYKSHSYQVCVIVQSWCLTSTAHGNQHFCVPIIPGPPSSLRLLQARAALTPTTPQFSHTQQNDLIIYFTNINHLRSVPSKKESCPSTSHLQFQLNPFLSGWSFLTDFTIADFVTSHKAREHSGQGHHWRNSSGHFSSVISGQHLTQPATSSFQKVSHLSLFDTTFSRFSSNRSVLFLAGSFLGSFPLLIPQKLQASYMPALTRPLGFWGALPFLSRTVLPGRVHSWPWLQLPSTWLRMQGQTLARLGFKFWLHHITDMTLTFSKSQLSNF